MQKDAIAIRMAASFYEGGLTSLHLTTKEELQTQFEVLQQIYLLFRIIFLKLRPHTKHRPPQNLRTTELWARNQTTV
jgi:hypothetical protein